jgi:hypothetical protein
MGAVSLYRPYRQDGHDSRAVEIRHLRPSHFAKSERWHAAAE